MFYYTVCFQKDFYSYFVFVIRDTFFLTIFSYVTIETFCGRTYLQNIWKTLNVAVTALKMNINVVWEQYTH